MRRRLISQDAAARAAGGRALRIGAQVRRLEWAGAQAYSLPRTGTSQRTFTLIWINSEHEATNRGGWTGAFWR